MAQWEPQPAPGYRAGYCAWLDPLVRAGVANIYRRHLAAESPDAYANTLDRGDQLSQWITSPLFRADAA
jgi:hypothetical protein